MRVICIWVLIVLALVLISLLTPKPVRAEIVTKPTLTMGYQYTSQTWTSGFTSYWYEYSTKYPTYSLALELPLDNGQVKVFGSKSSNLGAYKIEYADGFKWNEDLDYYNCGVELKVEF